MNMPRKWAEFIADHFCQIFPDGYNNPRMQKAEALYSLAQSIPAEGIVLEIGTYHGCGTVALAAGCMAAKLNSVVTLDDYATRTGWAGELYNMGDRAVFEKAKNESALPNITLIQKEQSIARADWQLPLSLVFWDLWSKDTLPADLDGWGKWLVRGGVFAIHEMAGGSLGSGDLFAAKIAAGEYESWLSYPGGHVYSIRKL